MDDGSGVVSDIGCFNAEHLWISTQLVLLCGIEAVDMHCVLSDFRVSANGLGCALMGAENSP